MALTSSAEITRRFFISLGSPLCCRCRHPRGQRHCLWWSTACRRITGMPSVPPATPYFDSNVVPSSHAFVAWLDALGTKSALLVSHHQATNFVMKIHACCLEAAQDPAVSLFPMNDGVFVVSAQRDSLRLFLTAVMTRLALMFVGEELPPHRFMVRGAVAYGALSHGAGLHGNNHTLKAKTDYVSRIVLGMPLAQAVEAERHAPPFGFFVHESARQPGPSIGRWPHVLWPWWKSDDAVAVAQVQQLATAVNAHLSWAEAHPLSTMYPADAIKRHRAAADEYFGVPA